VENHEAVGEFTVAQLHAFDSSVQWVRDADEALKMDLHQYDLVFSVVQMPGSIDGVDLAKEIARRLPELLILLASGYVIAPERLQELKVRIIAKHHTVETLQGTLLASLR
jgi:CheY-like chemotaxis protein